MHGIYYLENAAQMRLNQMEYKEYTGSAAYSTEDGCLIGQVLGIDSSVSYDGDSLEAIRKAFEEAVDDYLAMCEFEGLEYDFNDKYLP